MSACGCGVCGSDVEEAGDEWSCWEFFWKKLCMTFFNSRTGSFVLGSGCMGLRGKPSICSTSVILSSTLARNLLCIARWPPVITPQ